MPPGRVTPGESTHGDMGGGGGDGFSPSDGGGGEGHLLSCQMQWSVAVQADAV